MTEIKYCEGCGALLQFDDPKKIGYIPKSAVENEQIICQRCFRIKNYNEVMPIQIDENDFVQILNSIRGSNSIVINIVDLFDIDGTMINGLPRFIGSNSFIMVANKTDLFPKTIKENKIKNWLKKYTKDHGLYPKEIFLMSAERNKGIEEIAEYIDAHKGSKDIYVVGATNVGKSSFINKLLSNIYQDKKIELTTSKFPGTTLNTVYIPLTDKTHIIDTPGVVNKDRYSELVSPQTLKTLLPKKQIKPKVYQLYNEQTLFLGGLARIDHLNSAHNSFVVYATNDIQIHRTKLENAQDLYERQLGDLLTPPSKEEANKLPKQAKHSFKIPAGKKMDIVISGLGWISVDGESTNVDVYAPKGIGVHLRDALI